MRLLVVSGSPLEQVGETYYAYDTWLRVVQYLGQELGEVTVWSPLRSRTDAAQIPSGAWRVEPEGLRIETHEYFNSFNSYYRQWPFLQARLKRRLGRLLAEHDLILLRSPSPMLGMVMAEARRRDKPVVMMVLGNLATQAAGLVTYRGVKRMAFKSAVAAVLLREILCGRRSRELIVYSREIAARHVRAGSRPKLMQDPSIKLTDIVHREDTCLGDEIRLLRVSWLVPTKGLESLIDAVALLRADGMNVVLDIVGHERSTGYQESLRSRATERGAAEVVRFRGWVPATEIADVYLQSDIQIISSLSEGTPRCIAEGFARGVALVCTAVGGCVDLLKDEGNALLVPPGDSHAMAAAIRRMSQDGNLRRRLIQAGYATALEATVEVLGARFVSILRQAVDTTRPVLRETSDLSNV
jgi:glycosyltransferase involved in cell wall biosynthesis